MEERIEELEVKIKELLDDKKYHQIRELLIDLNEADIAEIIETIEIKEDVVRVFRLLPKDSAADVFSYIPVEYEQMIIESLTMREIGQIMNDLYSMCIRDRFNVVETLLRIVREQLPVAIKEPTNYEARATMLWAASCALNSFCTSGYKTNAQLHALEQLSSTFDLTHGLGLAIITPVSYTHLCCYVIACTT